MPKHATGTSLAKGSPPKKAKGPPGEPKKADDDDVDKENNNKKQTPKTPFARYFDRLDAFLKERDMLGHLMTKGIQVDHDEDSDDEEGSDNSKYTEEQMASLRFVLINQNRSDQLDRMRGFILGEQADSNFLMFNTSFAWDVRDGFYYFKEMFNKIKKWPEKFDILFAYTHELHQYDCWMHDNEGELDDMVSQLASMWKRLLKKDDVTLGIDAEYTRPGVVTFLEKFKTTIEACYSEPPFQFKFR
mmetsp:Transcript_56572/g.164086  ORF Transcript_56572/g.164086 Transcript_56572/m.164086 type:complete len:245 (-) Transcript_56572:185-919(-)|eukprot:CAMPEP_0176152438 /NCGR_PEP_ID=MMETSP0120_2-20121206/77856_1 /TAXON_ID=160619 /ORGANISM="Kryptoperidinium foliaceum, Strain CCMP 1326" /LENGTH=244 /DNA_ID=CAMNT_0017489445 /DNA_START=84 /DNA_END=818 /DNA_ORIENTATION=+